MRHGQRVSGLARLLAALVLPALSLLAPVLPAAQPDRARTEANLKELKDRRRIIVTVDLRGRPKGTYDEPVKVTLPENVGLVKTIPEQVHVTLY